MKVRDSGMPPRDYWESLLDVPGILDAFGFGPSTGDVVELGCGYGTFTLPLARRIGGGVHALDIDAAMVAATRQLAEEAALASVRAEVRDVLADGFGRPAGSCDAALLFSILHTEKPVPLLQAAREVVRPGGLVAVIHWRSDLATPRGPDLAIRPRPEQVRAWATAAGLHAEVGGSIAHCYANPVCLSRGRVTCWRIHDSRHPCHRPHRLPRRRQNHPSQPHPHGAARQEDRRD